MNAAGIDLGGTKIAAQIFDSGWNRVDERRISTPVSYDALVAAMAEQIRWIDDRAGPIPVGIAAAGLVNGSSGLAFTANLPATNRPFPADIAQAAGRAITYVNDCRAQTLSEAIFGAGRGFRTVVGVSIGTGLAGGCVIAGQLAQAHSGLAGEYGHFALSANVMAAHQLPVLRCGCGRMGCVETLVSGPGLARLVAHRTGRNLTPAQIVEQRQNDPDLADCWSIWCDLLVELFVTLGLTLDPDVIVLGGGLGQIPGLLAEIAPLFAASQLAGFPVPNLRQAEGGDASAARGAAYAALMVGDGNA